MTAAPWPRSSPKNSHACCLCPLHPFSTDLDLPVRSAKTIYVRFDLNDYSIPPEAVRRQLTLVASDTLVRILDGSRRSPAIIVPTTGTKRCWIRLISKPC